MKSSASKLGNKIYKILETHGVTRYYANELKHQ